MPGIKSGFKLQRIKIALANYYLKNERLPENLQKPF